MAFLTGSRHSHRSILRGKGRIPVNGDEAIYAV